jgi:putative phosphoesterase
LESNSSSLLNDALNNAVGPLGMALKQIAVLSDTHGLLRPEVVAACLGVDHILHAGDVGDPDILRRLAEIAPVTAIRGNIDTQGPCAALPATEMVELGGTYFYLIHSVADLDIDPVAADVQVVVSGHSHQPKEERHNGVLYLNPGSVGPRRFRLPVAMSYLWIEAGAIKVENLTFAV